MNDRDLWKLPLDRLADRVEADGDAADVFEQRVQKLKTDELAKLAQRGPLERDTVEREVRRRADAKLNRMLARRAA